MNKKLVAKELIKIAKELTASNPVLIGKTQSLLKTGDIIEFLKYKCEMGEFSISCTYDASKKKLKDCCIFYIRPSGQYTLDVFHQKEVDFSIKNSHFNSLSQAIKSVQKIFEKYCEKQYESNKENKKILKDKSGYFWD